MVASGVGEVHKIKQQEAAVRTSQNHIEGDNKNWWGNAMSSDEESSRVNDLLDSLIESTLIIFTKDSPDICIIHKPNWIMGWIYSLLFYANLLEL